MRKEDRGLSPASRWKGGRRTGSVYGNPQAPSLAEDPSVLWAAAAGLLRAKGLGRASQFCLHHTFLYSTFILSHLGRGCHLLREIKCGLVWISV